MLRWAAIALLFCLLGHECATANWHRRDAYEYWIDTTPHNFEGAKLACERMNASLAKVDSWAVDKFVTRFTGKTIGYFIGLRRYQDYTFKWLNGDLALYSNWGRAQPNISYQGLDEQCVVVVFRPDGFEWHDQLCSKPAGRICQRPYGMKEPTQKSSDIEQLIQITDGPKIGMIEENKPHNIGKIVPYAPIRIGPEIRTAAKKPRMQITTMESVSNHKKPLEKTCPNLVAVVWILSLLLFISICFNIGFVCTKNSSTPGEKYEKDKDEVSGRVWSTSKKDSQRSTKAEAQGKMSDNEIAYDSFDPWSSVQGKGRKTSEHKADNSTSLPGMMDRPGTFQPNFANFDNAFV